jgi:hypothetical protein
MATRTTIAIPRTGEMTIATPRETGWRATRETTFTGEDMGAVESLTTSLSEWALTVLTLILF